MTAAELHLEFKFICDKLDTLNYPNFLSEEIDLILNNAQEIARFFMITIEPTTRATFEQILAIYTACGVRFTGNISISHIIGQLCEGLTGTGMQTESSQSPDKPLEVRTEMEQMCIHINKQKNQNWNGTNMHSYI